MISKQTILALWFLDVLESKKKKIELVAKYPGSFPPKKATLMFHCEHPGGEQQT